MTLQILQVPCESQTCPACGQDAEFYWDSDEFNGHLYGRPHVFNRGEGRWCSTCCDAPLDERVLCEQELDFD